MSNPPEQRWVRIIPVAFIMYTIAYVDRTNISLALPYIGRDLHMDPAQQGNAFGIFFAGYMLLQIPGGYLAEWWSAKRFVSTLLVVWGACAVGCGLVHTQMQFWIMRFLLGVAEGGVWPATLILLAHWFPSRRAGACQRLLDALPARGRGGFVSPLRLDSRPLGLARHDRFRGRAAISLAADLELGGRRPPARSPLDFR